jgi:hypothetical protein
VARCEACRRGAQVVRRFRYLETEYIGFEKRTR